MIIFSTKFCRNFAKFTKISEIWQNLTKFAKIRQNRHFREKSGKNRVLRLKLMCFGSILTPKISVVKKKMSKKCKNVQILHFLQFSGNFPPDFGKTYLKLRCFFSKKRCFFDKNFKKNVIFFGNRRSPSLVSEFTWRENLNFCNLLFRCNFFSIFGSFYSPKFGKCSVVKIFWHVLFLPLWLPCAAGGGQFSRRFFWEILPCIPAHNKVCP